MSDTNGVSVERRPPEAMFALLGNETRLGILRALVESDGPVSFSGLRERVGVRDSGQFNYHLGKLVGTFVKQDDEGYELTLAGLQLVGALVAGTYTAVASMDPIELDDPCPSCGGNTLRVTYDDEQVHVHCTACEVFRNQFSFPPGTLDQYDREELPGAFDRWLWTLFQRITAGFCANCAGRLAGSLDIDEDPPRVEWRCERCGDLASTSASTPVRYHPAAQGFFHDHGIDLGMTPSWRLSSHLTTDETIDGEAVIIEVTLDGDTLTARVGSDGTVTDVSRSDR
ncbi:winged helix-turn-helix domain-containing protein [Halomarina litorea]|uniref:winged helix-turn-helix domain-containing protein n=1 Tax=Halomarina litorea TaxID=2961595 RepID=UPI0020C45026|nr:helix-turn-helix domain-containing protein [Halomarina sp. BCD28]